MYLEEISFPKHHPGFSLCRYITLDVSLEVMQIDAHSFLHDSSRNATLYGARRLFSALFSPFIDWSYL